VALGAKLNSKKTECAHDGEAGFLASPSVGFIQNPDDARCIHCAWNDLMESLAGHGRIDQLSFVLNGWRVDVVKNDAEILCSVGSTPAKAMDAMTRKLKGEAANAKKNSTN
jgi:hypothetical protein